MDIEVLIKTIKEEVPSKAIDLTESLELLRETINDTMIAVNDKANEAFSERDFSARTKYDKVLESIYQYEVEFENLIERLDVERETPIAVEDEVVLEKKTIPNYAEYTVDQNVVHNLYEDFTHKRPHAFQVDDQELIEISTWKEMLVKASEFIITLDENKFLSFEENPHMNGKKNRYFSVSKEMMIGEPRSVLDKIYVETNMSGNSIRNLILKMLNEYGIPMNHFKIYLRADYSELNKKV